MGVSPLSASFGSKSIRFIATLLIGFTLPTVSASPALAWHYFWNLDSTHSSAYGHESGYGNIQFLNQKTLKHEEWLADACGTAGGDNYGIMVRPVINTPVISQTSPDYYNTSGCGTTVYYHQDAREVWYGGVPRDLVNVYWQFFLTNNGQNFNYSITPCYDNPLRAGTVC